MFCYQQKMELVETVMQFCLVADHQRPFLQVVIKVQVSLPFPFLKMRLIFIPYSTSMIDAL